MKGNAGQEITSESARLNEMKINFAKIRSQAETLARRLMEDADLKGSWILGRNLLELEQNERALREEIQRAEQSLEDREDAKFDPDLLKGYLNDFTRVYEKMPLEQKRRLNHALFSGIVSFINRGEDKGGIEIKIRGDGSLKRTWEDLKKEDQVRQVRTPGSLGSATGSIPRTTFWSRSRLKSRIWVTAKTVLAWTPSGFKQSWGSPTPTFIAYSRKVSPVFAQRSREGMSA